MTASVGGVSIAEDESISEAPMPQRFTLTLDIDAPSLSDLSSSGAQLAIAKPAGVLPPNVIWLTCELARCITITWDEIYGVYGALVPSHTGALIRILDTRYPITDRTVHPFLSNCCFAPPIVSVRIPSGHYDVDNRTPFTATFGLLQAATIDGANVRSPINAATLVPGSRADFVSVTALHVWVGQPVAAGSTTAGLPPNASFVAFTLHDPDKKLRYDPLTARFVLTR
jgi:hypothetical protein